MQGVKIVVPKGISLQTAINAAIEKLNTEGKRVVNVSISEDRLFRYTAVLLWEK